VELDTGKIAEYEKKVADFTDKIKNFIPGTGEEVDL
jgi:hypothetical protein